MDDDVALYENFHLANGKEIYVSFGAYRAEDGVRVSLVGDLVVFTLYNRYGELFPNMGILERNSNALAHGLRQERAALEAMGLKGHFTGPPDFRVKNWDEVQSQADQAVAKAASER